jgi:hypothetical protein
LGETKVWQGRGRGGGEKKLFPSSGAKPRGDHVIGLDDISGVKLTADPLAFSYS